MRKCYVTGEFEGGGGRLGGTLVERRVQRCDFINRESLEAGMNPACIRH